MPAPIQLRLFDTLTRARHPLPLSSDEKGPLLRLYVCGITPYDSGHMGHAFTYAAFDVLIRYVEACGVRVAYVQNVTDVDTPLFERAAAQGIGWDQLAERELSLFVADMSTLGWRAPDVMPKASEEIDSINAALDTLRQSGCTYTTDATYFATDKYPPFGELSKLNRNEMIEKLRQEELLGEVGPDAKRSEVDFALWLPSGEGQPQWDSVAGRGRPGWHIECSAMSMRYLGPQLDVHGGGRDLVFSHHESERAQSESITNVRPFAKLWMHTGLVHCDDVKMSKSLGNLVLVREALRDASPAGLRLYLASKHYREDWNFEHDGLAAKEDVAARAREKLSGRRSDVDIAELRGTQAGARFVEALEDDLNTPRAVQIFEETLDADPAIASVMLQLLAGSASLDRAA